MYQTELSDYEARGRIEKFSAIFSLIILCLSIFLLGLSSYGLFDVDETRYAATAIEMVNSGDYIVPTFNGEPQLEKPILFYWLEAGAYKTFGSSPASFRLVSASIAFALVMLLGYVTFRESRVESGFLAGGILATSPLFAHLGRTVMTDMAFSAFIFLSSLFLYLGIFDSKNINRTLVRAGFLFMALASLTKGFTGLTLPLLTIVIFSWLNGRLKRMLSALSDHKAIILFLAIFFPWYGAILVQKGGGYFFDFFIRENVQRFFSPATGHRGPIYFYIPIVLIGFFPWSFFLPQAIFDMLKERGFSIKTVGENISLDMFLLIYSLVIFIFFSLSSSKLPPFILPIFPALCMLVSFYLEKILVYRRKSDLGLSVGVYVYGFASFSIGLLLLFPRDYFPIIHKAGLEKIIFIPGLILISASFLSVTFNVFREKIRRPRTKIFASILIPQMLFLWFAFLGVQPRVYQYRQLDLKNISQAINDKAGDDSSVIFFRKFKPSVVMLTGKKVQRAGSFEELIALTREKKEAFVIFRGTEGMRTDLSSLGSVTGTYRSNLYSLYKINLE